MHCKVIFSSPKSQVERDVHGLKTQCCWHTSFLNNPINTPVEKIKCKIVNYNDMNQKIIF